MSAGAEVAGVSPPGADVAAMGSVPAQMWQRWAQSRRRCGSDGPSPGADVARTCTAWVCTRKLCVHVLTHARTHARSPTLIHPLARPHGRVSGRNGQAHSGAHPETSS